ncbi:hypothetical protein MTO96_002666 [Rhipicephalus appendiculatus]
MVIVKCTREYFKCVLFNGWFIRGIHLRYNCKIREAPLWQFRWSTVFHNGRRTSNASVNFIPDVATSLIVCLFFPRRKCCHKNEVCKRTYSHLHLSTPPLNWRLVQYCDLVYPPIAAMYAKSCTDPRCSGMPGTATSHAHMSPEVGAPVAAPHSTRQDKLG